MIEYKETEQGFLVKIPYELKDLFKKSFAKIKWDSDSKRWIVALDQKNRLIQWLDAAKKTAEEIETHEKELLNEEELTELQSEFESIQKELRQKRKQTTDFLTVGSTLKEAEKNLEKARADLKTETDQYYEARGEAYRLMTTFLDIKEIMQSIEKMKKNQGGTHSKNRVLYQEAQSEVGIHLKKLWKLGFDCYAMRQAYYALYNRPDRDCVKWITLDDLLLIKKVQSSE